MSRPENHLLHRPELSRIGNGVMRVAGRLSARVSEVQDQAEAHYSAGLPNQTVHSLIYARPHFYRHNRFREEPPLDHLMEQVAICISDINYQNQKAHQPGSITVAVNRSKRSDFTQWRLKEKYDADLMTFPPSFSHPAAYNKLINTFQSEGLTGLLWMTQPGARMATKQAFNASALAIGGELGVAAVQGMPLAGRESRFFESSLYNLGSTVKFPGHRPKPARAGAGFLAVNRSVVSLDALYAQSQSWPEYPSHSGPFNPAYGNGGFDGELGGRIGPVLMDQANSVIWYEHPHYRLNLAQDASSVVRTVAEWASYFHPNDYMHPPL